MRQPLAKVLCLCLFLLLSGRLRANVEGWVYWNSFPWVYSSTEGAWLYFLIDGDSLWVNHVATGRWEKLFGPDQIAPESLRGKKFLISTNGIVFAFALESIRATVHIIGDRHVGSYLYRETGVASAVLNITVSGDGSSWIWELDLTFESSNSGTTTGMLTLLGEEPRQMYPSIFSIQD